MATELYQDDNRAVWTLEPRLDQPGHQLMFESPVGPLVFESFDCLEDAVECWKGLSRVLGGTGKEPLLLAAH